MNPPRRDDAAVSSVVAAVLIFSLFSAAFLVWSLTTLPEWVADREQVHLEEVRSGIAGLATQLDRLSVQGDAGPATAHVPLGAPRVPLLQPTGSRGEIALTTPFSVTGVFEAPRLQLLDGALHADPTTPVGGAVVADVHTMEVLQVALTTSGIANNQRGVKLSVLATDGNSTVTADVQHVGSQFGVGGCDREVSVVVAGPGVSRSQILLCSVGSSLNGYVVDLMDLRFGFRTGLAALDAPITITFDTVVVAGPGEGVAGMSISGTYAAVWQDATGATRAAGASGGAGYALDMQGAALTFTPHHQRLYEQRLSWQGGALVAAQADGAAVVADPAFHLSQDGSTGFLRWTLVQITGEGALQGADLATVRATHLSSSRALVTAEGGTFTITSQEAAAWRAFLRDHIAASGADAAWGGDGETATLTLGTDTAWVLDLRIVHARVTLL